MPHPPRGNGRDAPARLSTASFLFPELLWFTAVNQTDLTTRNPQASRVRRQLEPDNASRPGEDEHFRQGVPHNSVLAMWFTAVNHIEWDSSRGDPYSISSPALRLRTLYTYIGTVGRVYRGKQEVALASTRPLR